MNSPTPASCPNCAAPQPDPPTPYCGHCGQETRVRAPTLLEFAQQFGGAYISTEGALWRTLKLLLRPGALTVEYLQGRRRSYVLPLRLYLTISVLSLALLRVLGDYQDRAEREADLVVALEKGAFYLTNVGSWGVGKVHGQFVCTGFPDWYCSKVRVRLESDPQSVLQHMKVAEDRTLGHMGQALFVLLPLLALWLKLLYWRSPRGLRYTEHLVFSLHLHCCWFLCLWLSPLPLPYAGTLALALAAGYTLLAMRRVYGGAWWATLWRTALLLSLQGLLLLLTLLLSLLWGVIA